MFKAIIQDMATTRASLTYVSLWKMLTNGTGNKKTFASRQDIIPLLEGLASVMTHCTRSCPSINRYQEISRIIVVPNIDNIFLQSFLSWQWIRVRFYWPNDNIQNVRRIPNVSLVNHHLHSQTSRYCYNFFGVVVLSNKLIDLFTNIQ